VCLPPSYIKAAHRIFDDQLTLGTVIGFPLGYTSLSVKLAELDAALSDGAAEFDTVVNLTDVKNGHYSAVTEEIAAQKRLLGHRVLKVIIETCYLTQDEKIRLCDCVTQGGADFIKTSTGFGTAGATLADVRLLKAHVGAGVQVKAAGGIRTREDMVAFLEAGATRLGTSNALVILEGKAAAGY
jgi:deoxyribose-phosphate aldolase